MIYLRREKSMDLMVLSFKDFLKRPKRMMIWSRFRNGWLQHKTWEWGIGDPTLTLLSMMYTSKYGNYNKILYILALFQQKHLIKWFINPIFSLLYFFEIWKLIVNNLSNYSIFPFFWTSISAYFYSKLSVTI